MIKKPVMGTKDLRFFDDPDAQTLPDGHARRGISVVAAAYVGVSIQTVRRWIASRQLAGYRVGPRLLRIDPDDVDRMLTLIPTARAL